ncbi:hypothetical protein Bca52824_084635 [Brassica carinata]|uniref:Uncharacterized protein n=1 Tax=Brassica carinata TaxID=52824 RepID=A0A8X7PRT2_BRACI|nr:hypothetical protein Bca52824_084635 [Brassica carinata]
MTLLQNLTETDLRRYETPPARRDAAESLANVIIIEPGMQCFVCLDDFECKSNGTISNQGWCGFNKFKLSLLVVVLCFALLPNFDAIITALEKRLERDIVKRALSYPLKLIAKNARINGSVISEKVLPTRTLSSVTMLQPATSVAKMFLMSDCVVLVEIKEPEPVPAQATRRLWTTQARSDIH